MPQIAPSIRGPEDAPTHGSQDLLEKLRSVLNARGYRLDLDFCPGEQERTMVISGKVPSFHVRQIVLDCARRSAGGRLIDDRLAVESRN